MAAIKQCYAGDWLSSEALEVFVSDLKVNLVDLVGIEPTTSSMPWKRAPSCATGPLWLGSQLLATHSFSLSGGC